MIEGFCMGSGTHASGRAGQEFLLFDSMLFSTRFFGMWMT